MGLTISHGAFHGSYSAFNRLRQAVAAAIGGSFPPHTLDGLDPDQWYWGPNHTAASHPGLRIFFDHSDCDGEISPSDCTLVADDLEPLIARLHVMGPGEGHIASRGGYAAALRTFTLGCRFAAACGEALKFL